MRSLVVFVGERYYEAYVRDNRQARREEEKKRRMIQPSLRASLRLELGLEQVKPFGEGGQTFHYPCLELTSCDRPFSPS